MAEKVKMLIPEEEVNARIEELGKKISEEYAGKQEVKPAQMWWTH